ncbi:MAG: hypothetical protein KDJ69_15680 [Nitratireductor sp.]|nr:hypothetical protein [Nitratireductor sp.]
MCALLVGLSVKLCLPHGKAHAQEAGKTPQLSIELNRLEQLKEACRATFVLSNGLQAGISEIALELVLFNPSGLVEQMRSFDFGEVVAGKTVVRRFDLNGTDCAEISRILINSVSKCAGDGLDAGKCSGMLVTANRAGIEFGT